MECSDLFSPNDREFSSFEFKVNDGSIYIYSKPYIPILLTVQNISMQTVIKRIVQLNKIAVDLCTEIKLIICILLNLRLMIY